MQEIGMDTFRKIAIWLKESQIGKWVVRLGDGLRTVFDSRL